MKVEYHPAAVRDVASAIKRYEAASAKLSSEFEDELRLFIERAAANPGRFHFVRAAIAVRT